MGRGVATTGSRSIPQARRLIFAKDQAFLREALLKERQNNFMELHVGLPRVFSAREAEELGIEVSSSGLPLYVCGYESCPMYLKPLWAPLTDAEAIAAKATINAVGEPLCTRVECPRAGKRMVCRRATPEEAETGIVWMWRCLHERCDGHLVRNAEPTKFASTRALRQHLAPLEYPRPVYVKALHVHARTVVRRSPTMDCADFVQIMLPYGIGLCCAFPLRPWLTASAQ